MEYGLICGLAILFVGAGCGGEDDTTTTRRDEDLFGLMGAKGESTGLDVEAIRNLSLSGFTTDEIIRAMDYDERIAAYLDEHLDVRTHLNDAMYEIKAQSGAVGSPIAVVSGHGYDWAFGGGVTSRRLQVNFKTPSGSIASQWFALQGNTAGLQYGATYGATIGLVFPRLGSTPLRLRDLDSSLVEGKLSANPLVFISPILALIPLTTAVKFMVGDDYVMVLVDIGIGYHYGLSASDDHMLDLRMERESPPVLKSIAQ